MNVTAGSSPTGSGATRVTAIVPVFDGAPFLDACLGALLATPLEADVTLAIVVVDDGSRDASVAVAQRVAAASGNRVQVLALGCNHGFAGAVNRGIAWAHGGAPDVIALVNQDCIVSGDWLMPLLRALADPTVAVAGARLLDVDGVTLQHAGARIAANGLTSHVGRGSTDDDAWREAADVDYVCAALVAMRAQAWTRIGPFDEGYAPAYFEEVDWCARARAQGLRCVYVPDSSARHVEASCTGRQSRLFLQRYHSSRMRYVVRRLVPERGWLAWLRAEAAWLTRLRRWNELSPVLAAYRSVPRLIAERHHAAPQRPILS